MGDWRNSKHVAGMEHGLYDRDRIGVQDAVILEDYHSERAFVDNLNKRFKENLIYTYIGNVLVSVNPYKELPIYTNKIIEEYQKTQFFDAPPHIFAIADTAYRSLREERRQQCILISGESGSGKTEASKKVLQFVAAVTGHLPKVETVKNKLLQSNPVLEAFGNAKTNRNDNSSRFGKYMDIQFNYMGAPIGGNILSYLLEKSRVVQQAPGERTFHIFYQMLAGVDDATLHRLHLTRDTSAYQYIRNKTGQELSGDKPNFYQVMEAMSTMELSKEEQNEILDIVASVLHLGNVSFTEEEGIAEVEHPYTVDVIAKILGCNSHQLRCALVNRTIDANGDVVISPLSKELAVYARDALAKAVYDRLFTWLVGRLNHSLHPTREPNTTVMGILDIYGFEIFAHNSFEQFCINFCNEKLQQLFVELTLKSEQEEYLKEGIEWEPVQYFNNKVICDLIEEKHRGIIAIMDEECLRPGEPTDFSLLEKMNGHLAGHKHYIYHEKADKKTQKQMGRDEFRLVHYAGDVTYCVEGFLEKNNDLLFRDLREAMSTTSNSITKEVFPLSQLYSRKRPETAATQFKNSVNQLMDILMTKEPSYIRCIKPNDFQKPAMFDDYIVTHQVKYLGLMENLRVRRAGFAYRRPYETFLQRYKSLCPTTWPHYKGSAKDGVIQLIRYIGYKPDDYRIGNTKLFIRSPKTLFSTEDAFQARKHDLVTIIKKTWKGHKQRKEYLRMRRAVILIQRMVRGLLARREAQRRRQAVIVIKRFIKGFITRDGPETDINRKFISIAKQEWLNRLSRSLPRSVLDRSWPSCPNSCVQASEYLHSLHTLWLARKYRQNLSAAMKQQFNKKVLAESLFKNKKKSYLSSIGPLFVDDRLTEEQRTLKQSFISSTSEKLLYCSAVTKYDRHGYKPRERALMITSEALYLLEGRTFKLKHRLPLDSIIEVSVTSEADSLLLLRIPSDLKKDKGDLILEVPNVIEAVTYLVTVTNRPGILNVLSAGTIAHNLASGKQGTIDITTGTTPAIVKGKTGHLIVATNIAPCIEVQISNMLVA